MLLRVLSCAIGAVGFLHFMDHPEAVAEDDSGLWDYHADRGHRDGTRFVGEVIAHGPGHGRAPPASAPASRRCRSSFEMASPGSSAAAPRHRAVSAS